MLECLLTRLCEKLAERCSYRVIPRPDGAPYLVRYYLMGRRATEQRGLFNLYLHHFLSGDAESELHSHPWQSSFSLILTGGYTEERRIGRHVIKRVLKPLSINIINAEDFHRVDLLKDHTWTLFVAGRPSTTWYFWDRWTDKTIPWQSHIFTRRQRQGAQFHNPVRGEP